MLKVCTNCHSGFEVLPQDKEFLAKLSPVISGKNFEISEPNFCQQCREMRRLSFRNQNKLFKRSCNLCNKETVSMYKKDAPFNVYCNDCWWSDKWDSLAYGIEYDFSKTFFQQFYELKLKVPHLALHASHNDNSDFVNLSGYNKNCYLLFAAEFNEDCQYATQLQNSRKCFDALYTYYSEYCYQVVDVSNCYNLWFSRNCKNCSDSAFLYDCIGSKNCLFSTNLRNKEYFIFNKQYSSEEYESKKKEIFNLIAKGELKELEIWYDGIVEDSLHKNLEISNSENCIGNYLTNCQNLYIGFDSNDVQDGRYLTTAVKSKDAMDCSHIYDVEKVYEGTSVGYGSNSVYFALGAWSSNNVIYVDNVHHSSDLFGCIGMQKKKFCILNKQYTKEQYEALVPKIIEHMKISGEWGEFFPSYLSPFKYEDTLANEYFPLAINQALNIEYKIESTDHNLIKCHDCSKLFKLNLAEIEFYKSMGLCNPLSCPDCRHKKRFLSRQKRRLYQSQCCKCNLNLLTTYNSENLKKVYCEKCYLAEIY